MLMDWLQMLLHFWVTNLENLSIISIFKKFLFVFFSVLIADLLEYGQVSSDFYRFCTFPSFITILIDSPRFLNFNQSFCKTGYLITDFSLGLLKFSFCEYILECSEARSQILNRLFCHLIFNNTIARSTFFPFFYIINLVKGSRIWLWLIIINCNIFSDCTMNLNRISNWILVKTLVQITDDIICLLVRW